jgi:hypothetical protein
MARGGIAEGRVNAAEPTAGTMAKVFCLNRHELEQIRPDRDREAIRRQVELLRKTTKSVFN